MSEQKKSNSSTISLRFGDKPMWVVSTHQATVLRTDSQGIWGTEDTIVVETEPFRLTQNGLGNNEAWAVSASTSSLVAVLPKRGRKPVIRSALVWKELLEEGNERLWDPKYLTVKRDDLAQKLLQSRDQHS